MPRIVFERKLNHDYVTEKIIWDKNGFPRPEDDPFLSLIGWDVGVSDDETLDFALDPSLYESRDSMQISYDEWLEKYYPDYEIQKYMDEIVHPFGNSGHIIVPHSWVGTAVNLMIIDHNILNKQVR